MNNATGSYEDSFVKTCIHPHRHRDKIYNKAVSSRRYEIGVGGAGPWPSLTPTDLCFCGDMTRDHSERDKVECQSCLGPPGHLGAACRCRLCPGLLDLLWTVGTVG